jgi:pimeloyl-ACP methyl ester carboxylesterase
MANRRSGGSVTIEKTVDLVGEIIAAEGHAQAHLVGVSLGSLMAQAVAIAIRSWSKASPSPAATASLATIPPSAKPKTAKSSKPFS